MRDFFNILLLVLVVPVLSAERIRQMNPTAPNDAFLYVTGNFTDSDRDGMTDVAENRFGYDPNDATSFPKETYFLEENSTMTEVPREEQVLLSPNNRFYYKLVDFHKFGDNDLQKQQEVRNFLAKVMPIMYDRLGVPVENIICKVKCMGNVGVWYATENGRKLLIGNYLNHRVLVHEIIHAWKGGYNLGSPYSFYGYNGSYMGFEEGITDAMSYEIMREYVRAYPTEEFSQDFVFSGWWQYTTSVANNDYDLIKFLPQTTAGLGFTNNIEVTFQRYGIAGNTFLQWITKNPNAYKNMFERLITIRKTNYNFYFSRENLMDSINARMSSISGEKLRDVFNAIPVLSTKSLDERLYPIILPHFDARTGTGLYRYGITYSYQGWTSTSVHESEISEGRFPDYLKYTNYTDWRTNESNPSRYVFDFRNQPLIVSVHDIQGNHYGDFHHETPYEEDEHGNAPSGVIYADINNSLNASNFPFGLYKQTLNWPELSKHTDHARQDVYMFGAKNTAPYSPEELVVIIGFDCDADATMHITINKKKYIRPIVNGCVEIRSLDIPLDFTGTIYIAIESNGTTHNYERELLDQVPDGVHVSKFIITDTDFDGQEDQYQDEVGNKYIYRSESIPFETEFNDDKLIITWNEYMNDETLFVQYYNNNHQSKFTNVGGLKNTEIKFSKINLEYEDTISFRFMKHSTTGTRIFYPWVAIEIPSSKVVPQMSAPVASNAFKWDFTHSTHSKENPSMLCACYIRNKLDDVNESSLSDDEVVHYLTTEKKLLDVVDTKNDINNTIKVVADTHTGILNGVQILDNLLNSVDIIETKFVDANSSVNQDALASLQLNTQPTQVPNYLMDTGFESLDIGNESQNRKSSPSRGTDTIAQSEFKKRLNLNFEFVPAFDVNSDVPERETLSANDDVVENNESSDPNSTPPVIDINIDEVKPNQSDTSTENNNTKQIISVVDNVESVQFIEEVEQVEITTNLIVDDVTELTEVTEEIVNEWETNATHLGNGWYVVEWFGTFWKSESTDWIYHVDLGWVYLSSTSFDSVWIWHKTLGGWVWATEKQFSYVYNESTGGWFYIDIEARLYFDFMLDEWNKLDNTYSE